MPFTAVASRGGKAKSLHHRNIRGPPVDPGERATWRSDDGCRGGATRRERGDPPGGGRVSRRPSLGGRG